MPEHNEPEQIVLMKRMVALAEEQTRMSAERTRMAADRSRMSEDRSRMSEDRSRMSQERSRMSAERSEMSEMRSYMNAERTLSVWVRTALSLMIFGIAIDRFGLLLHQIPGGAHAGLRHVPLLNGLSTWSGAALVALGVIMVVSTGARFLAYAHAWRRQHVAPTHHGPYLATFFAWMVAVFGLLLLVIMIVYAG